MRSFMLRRPGVRVAAGLCAAAILCIGPSALAVVIAYDLPATALPSQSPPYPTVATLTAVQTMNGVQFTLDPDETSPGWGTGSFVERVDIAYAGDPLDAMDFMYVSGTQGDATFETNANNFDAGYAAQLYHIIVDFPSDPSDRLLPDGSATWTVLGAMLSDFTGTFATANNMPSPIYSVISVTAYSLPGQQPTPSNWVAGSVAAVPEPGTAMLLFLGLAGLASQGRKR